MERTLTRHRRVGWIAPLIAALTLAPFTARGDEGAAEVLFREGKALLDAGSIDAACIKLEESQRLDPSSGTLLNLALCHEKQGRLATARSEYVAAARLSRDQGRPARAEVAESKTAELAPRVPRLTIRVAGATTEMTVERDGIAVPPSLLGVEVEVDVAVHRITARAPGRSPFSVDVQTTAGESTTVEIPVLEPSRSPEAAPVPLTAPPVAAPAAASQAAPPRRESAPDADGTEVTGWILGGVSVVALGVGAAFGAASLSDYDEADELCPSRVGCSSEALDARDGAEAKAWVSNVTLGVGVVGLAVGVVLLVASSGDDEPPTSAVHLGPGGSRVVVGF